VKYALKKAVDSAKDQSYVLYGLGQEELARLLFPLGGYSKPEIRELARKYGLRTADKPDSYEICFVPNEDYKQFIDEEVPSAQRPSGPIRHKDGRVLGRHRGLPYYTIGQREGLGIAVGYPLYVIGLEKETNTLVVGEKPDVYSREMAVRDVTWVSGESPEFPTEISVKIRSKHTESGAKLLSAERVVFDEPQSAVTPGQAAVFYQGDIVIGGGFIKHGN
jgi:tRNA-specific 2-thiouridylase